MLNKVSWPQSTIKRWAFVPLLALVCAILGTAIIGGQGSGWGIGTAVGLLVAIPVAVMIDTRRRARRR
jgi:hypothetical protein